MVAASLWKLLGQLRRPQAAQIRDVFYLIESDDRVWTLPVLFLTAFYPYVYLTGLTHQPSDSYTLTSVLIVLLIAGSTVYSFLSEFSLLNRCVWSYVWSHRPVINKEESRAPKDASRTCPRSVPDELLQTTLEDGGLTETEVAERRLVYGPNQPCPTVSWSRLLLRICSQSWYSHSLAVLLHATRHRRLLHCFLNCLLWAASLRIEASEHKSNNETLQEYSWHTSEPALVLRAGKMAQVTAADLVPGDIIYGMRIPADAIPLSIGDPLWRKRGPGDLREEVNFDRCYVPQQIVEGDAFLTVANTGLRTWHGRIASYFAGHYLKPSEYMTELRSAGGVVSILIAASILTILAPSSASVCWRDAFKLFTNLAIVGHLLIPSKLDATMAAIHSGHLADQRLLDRVRGGGVQVLAGVDVLCVEKTKMVTDDDPTILRPLCFACSTEDLMLAAALTRHGNIDEHNATERALTKLLHRYPRVKASLIRHSMLDWQWNSKLDTSQSLIESPDGERVLFVRGTPHALKTKFRQEGSAVKASHKSLAKAARKNALQGMDTFGIAKRLEDGEWELLGALAVFDAPRFDSSFAVKLTAELGVSIKMFSYDSAAITKAIAQRIGLYSGTLMAKQALKMETEALARVDAFAVRDWNDTDEIIATMMEQGHRVAAAVESSDILEAVDFGISTEGASERRAAAADANLSQDGLSVLANAIKEARRMLQVKQNNFTLSMTEMLVILILQLWYLWRYRQILDLRVWILGNHISTSTQAIGQFYLGWDAMETQVSKRPLTWANGRPLREAMYYAVVASAGVLMVEQAIARSVSTTTTAVNSQAFSLYVLVVIHGLEGLIKAGPRFWTMKLVRRHIAAYAALDLGITCVCAIGWLVPGSQLSLSACVWVWTIAIATVTALWMMRRFVTRRGPYTFTTDLQPIWPRYLAPNELY